MSCIGTAGHVDHGKSTLVKVLTGIDPDRLTEEKERGMTIDLGFAWLTLPSGREVSIVDVPGHESFIKNMLAGVGGIDAALLVVAADEGVMPQTREHLAILNLLHVSRGVVALTKSDLVDEEWLELVREEIVEHLKPTTLADAAILPVSAYTRQGIPELLAELDRVLDVSQERQNIARPRLPIDRVFSMTGFGTVVTGTLLDGNFKLGQEVEILPQGMHTRIRTLQTHKKQVEQAQPGSRVAMNLANIARSDLIRGNVVVLPGQLRTTTLCDARIDLLPDAPRAIAHNTLVDFYVESQEIPAKVRLLNVDELQPGQSAWVQLRLERPAVLARRDRFILRIPSPSTTIGGGEVVDITPRYHKRFQTHLIESLERLARGTPEELLLAALDRRPLRTTSSRTMQGLIGYELADIAKKSNLSLDVTLQLLETLLSEGRVKRIGSLWFAQHIWDLLVEEAVYLVREYHEHYPLRSGLSKEEWRSHLKLSLKIANEVFAELQAEGILEALVETGVSSGLIRLPNFEPRFTVFQQQQVEQIVKAFTTNSYTPPTRAEAEAMASVEVVAALIEQGQLIKLGNGILFLRETYRQALLLVTDYLREHPTITVAEARDLLGASRKYILPLLEHMDTLRITKRVGDVRTLN
jgi:selenocysteine-specific elongation factor